MEQQKRKKNKIIFILLSVVICALFLTAIIQTFILKANQNTLNNLKDQTNQAEQEYNQAKEKHDNMFKTDITDSEVTPDDLKDEYKNEYIKHEGTDENGNPYGEDGEKVIEVQQPN